MPSIPPTLMAVAAVFGAMSAWAAVTVTVLIFLWNKLDKRFDDLEARQNQRFDNLEATQNRQFDDLKDGLGKLEARQEEALKDMRAEQREDNKALNEKLDRLLESRLPTPR